VLPANGYTTRKPERGERHIAGGVLREREEERGIKREKERGKRKVGRFVREKGEGGGGGQRTQRRGRRVRERGTGTRIQIRRVGGRCGKSAALRGRSSKDGE